MANKAYPSVPSYQESMPEPPPPYSTLPPPPVNPAFTDPSVGMYPKPQPFVSTGATAINVHHVSGVGTSVTPVMAGAVTGTSTVVVNVTSGLGSHSQRIVCPSCRQDVVTKTAPVAGLLTWILSGACLVFGCWLGCCLIPCCIRECQDIEHRCSNCKAYIGTYKRL